MFYCFQNQIGNAKINRKKQRKTFHQMTGIHSMHQRNASEFKLIFL